MSIAQAMIRFDAQMLAYCLTGNHSHFVLHTRQANLSAQTQHINGVYTQRFNRRHDKVGHLFQGRFKAILVSRDAYLLEVCRYVELNPVRSQMVAAPGEWPWSSYLARVDETMSPPWLDPAGLHGHLLGREATSAADRRRAAALCRSSGRGARCGVVVWGASPADLSGRRRLRGAHTAWAEPSRARGVDAPCTQRTQQRHIKRSLDQWLKECATREQALWSAYTRSGLRMTEMAQLMGLSVSRVSWLIGAEEARQQIAPSRKCVGPDV